MQDGQQQDMATGLRIGQSADRVEDEKFLRGDSRYVGDITLPGQGYGVVLRSPWAHARVTGLDCSVAAGMPGVLGIFTADDYQRDGLGLLPYVYPLAPGWDKTRLHNPGRRPLASDTVRHVGDALVFLVAESPAKARDAMEAIEVTYEPLPSITNTAEATAPSAPQVWDDCPRNTTFCRKVGNPDATDSQFAAAAHVVKDRLVISRVSANTIEPRGIVCDFDAESGVTTVYASAQSAFGLRRQLATSIFDEPEDRFHVIIRDVGGSFGMKGAFYPEYALVAWASRKLQRPVSWISDRSEAFISDYHSRDNVCDVELALDQDGKFLALRAHTFANLGAYPSTMPTGPTTSHVGGMAGVYTFQAAFVQVTGVYTHTNSTGSLRGAGRPEATYVIERIIDKAARQLGQDPAEMRLRNMIQPEQLPYRTPFYFKYDGDEFGFFEYDSGDFPKALNKGLAAADYSGFPARRDAARDRGLLRGIGVSYFIEMAASPGFEYAEVHAAADGSVTVLAGTANNGQGHNTVYTQVVCDVLGVAAASVTVIESDTGAMPMGSGTSSSRTTTIGGSAAYIAATELIESGKETAARLLQTAPDQVTYRDGRYFVDGSNSWVSLADVAGAVPASVQGADGPGLSGKSRYVAKAANWPNGCHLCEVEIDPETGKVAVDAYVCVDDAGRVMNHKLLDGQVHGGVAMGIGQVLFEQINYDTEGQLVTGSFMDYAMPRARDVCNIEVLTSPVPTRTNPLGTKGGGESGTIGSLACVMNAIEDALAQVGADTLEMPATPLRVWNAIHGIHND